MGGGKLIASKGAAFRQVIGTGSSVGSPRREVKTTSAPS